MEAPTPEPAPTSGVTLTEIDDPQSFFLEARAQGYCASCAYHGRTQIVSSWQAHHVIQRQRCRRERAPLFSPDDALRVCSGSPAACHERHTTHQELLPVGCLRDENIAFAERWLGAGPAIIYFETYYAGSDPRIDALLEQL